MKVLGTAAALATGTTSFDTTGQHAVYVFNSASSAVELFTRTAADAALGSVWVPATSGAVIHLADGQGLRGATTFKVSAIANVGY
ncbi:hypothetical protein N9F71_00925 [bacterium]|jgi:hypothetical protein|nr:hypothetical protein [bacterium]MDB4435682.1 hypothetical protein [bacterium]